MADVFELAILNGTCVVPNQNGTLQEVRTDIGIRNGRIEHIGPIPERKTGRILDAKGLHVLPGLIDSQVHFREPGMEQKEDLATGSASAALGGITGFFEMPNTKPPTTNALDFRDKMTRANGRSWTEYAFYIGASPQNATRLGDLEQMPGCCGTKIFMGSSTGDLLVEEDDVIETVLRSTRGTVAVHAEDEKRLRERRHLVDEKPGHPEMHPVWRDDQTAFLATERLLRKARKLGRRVHVLHVTTRQEMELLAQNRDIASVEVLPQHLTLTAPDCYERLGTYAQMNPPIRGKEHQEALWRAVLDGVVDVMGSDHAPHTKAEKEKGYPNTPSGMPGVQTTVPLMLNHVHQGRLSLVRFVELMAETPAKLFRIKNKGSIRVGNDADFTLVDLKAENIISNAWNQSRCGWTPYAGMKVTGWPISTIIRGQIVMRDATLIDGPVGRPLEFNPLTAAGG